MLAPKIFAGRITNWWAAVGRILCRVLGHSHQWCKIRPCLFAWIMRRAVPGLKYSTFTGFKYFSACLKQIELYLWCVNGEQFAQTCWIHRSWQNDKESYFHGWLSTNFHLWRSHADFDWEISFCCGEKSRPETWLPVIYDLKTMVVATCLALGGNR